MQHHLGSFHQTKNGWLYSPSGILGKFYSVSDAQKEKIEEGDGGGLLVLCQYFIPGAIGGGGLSIIARLDDQLLAFTGSFALIAAIVLGLRALGSIVVWRAGLTALQLSPGEHRQLALKLRDSRATRRLLLPTGVLTLVFAGWAYFGWPNDAISFFAGMSASFAGVALVPTIMGLYILFQEVAVSASQSGPEQHQ